ncbi:hypothetical protein LCGC14_2005270, partial [marine sediment metagenome]
DGSDRMEFTRKAREDTQCEETVEAIVSW